MSNQRQRGESLDSTGIVDIFCDSVFNGMFTLSSNMDKVWYWNGHVDANKCKKRHCSLSHDIPTSRRIVKEHNIENPLPTASLKQPNFFSMLNVAVPTSKSVVSRSLSIPVSECHPTWATYYDNKLSIKPPLCISFLKFGCCKNARRCISVHWKYEKACDFFANAGDCVFHGDSYNQHDAMVNNFCGICIERSRVVNQRRQTYGNNANVYAYDHCFWSNNVLQSPSCQLYTYIKWMCELKSTFEFIGELYCQHNKSSINQVTRDHYDKQMTLDHYYKCEMTRFIRMKDMIFHYISNESGCDVIHPEMACSFISNMCHTFKVSSRKVASTHHIINLHDRGVYHDFVCSDKIYRYDIGFCTMHCLKDDSLFFLDKMSLENRMMINFKISPYHIINDIFDTKKVSSSSHVVPLQQNHQPQQISLFSQDVNFSSASAGGGGKRPSPSLILKNSTPSAVENNCVSKEINVDIRRSTATLRPVLTSSSSFTQKSSSPSVRIIPSSSSESSFSRSTSPSSSQHGLLPAFADEVEIPAPYSSPRLDIFVGDDVGVSIGVLSPLPQTCISSGMTVDINPLEIIITKECIVDENKESDGSTPTSVGDIDVGANVTPLEDYITNVDIGQQQQRRSTRRCVVDNVRLRIKNIYGIGDKNLSKSSSTRRKRISPL